MRAIEGFRRFEKLVAAVAGSALQLAGGITVPNPLSLQPAANVTLGGVNFGGHLENYSGSNTYSGAIFAAFTSLPHLAMSFLISAAKASGPSSAMSAPCCCTNCFMSSVCVMRARAS